MGTQASANLTQPSPFPAFHSSSSDRAVTVCWLMSLVFSLCAALVATLVQQCARSYLRPLQRHDSLLTTLWTQIVLSAGVDQLQVVARAVPWFIHLSLVLFFLGLGSSIMRISTIVGVATIVPISICGFYYISSAITSITNPQWPYQNPLSNEMRLFFQNLRLSLYHNLRRAGVFGPRGIETNQGHPSTESPTKDMVQEVRAVQWLLDKINGRNKLETFVLAIPGTFDREWSRGVWKEVAKGVQWTPPADSRVSLSPGPPQEENAVFDLCIRVRQMFEAYNNKTEPMNEIGHLRMQGCVETVACLVFCADVPLDWFERVEEVLSKLGINEQIKEPSKIGTNPSFSVRWTCLSLVAIQQVVMVEGNRVRELAGFAVSGIARFQSDYGAPDPAASNGAQRIDEYLRTAWEHVEDLYQALEPWDQSKTGEEIRNILGGFESQISELERIRTDADGMDDVDWRISLFQDAMDEATHRLIQLLPGVSFQELKQSGPIPIREAFDFPVIGSTPITPQFVFPGQQLQGLFALGRGLRHIVEGRNFEKHKETLESLRSISKIPIPLRRLNHLMKRQLWRLQDLRDGGGFGFTIEIFFLALRQLLTISSSSELEQVLYIGTFKLITSGWEKSIGSSGTQRILLNLICDLVIPRRGVFSDFFYPAYIVDELLDLVEKMVDGKGGSRTHIDDAVQELQEINPGECMDDSFRNEVLRIITSPKP